MYLVFILKRLWNWRCGMKWFISTHIFLIPMSGNVIKKKQYNRGGGTVELSVVYLHKFFIIIYVYLILRLRTRSQPCFNCFPFYLKETNRCNRLIMSMKERERGMFTVYT